MTRSAVITGRPVETVDALLGDAPFAVAGEHGGAIRHAPGAALERPAAAGAARGWLMAAERSPRRIPARCSNARRAASRCTTARCPRPARQLREALAALLAGSADFELLAGTHDVGGAAARRRQGHGGRRA